MSRLSQSIRETNITSVHRPPSQSQSSDRRRPASAQAHASKPAAAARSTHPLKSLLMASPSTANSKPPASAAGLRPRSTRTSQTSRSSCTELALAAESLASNVGSAPGSWRFLFLSLPPHTRLIILSQSCPASAPPMPTQKPNTCHELQTHRLRSPPPHARKTSDPLGRLVPNPPPIGRTAPGKKATPILRIARTGALTRVRCLAELCWHP
jgi:hypothetical protein